MGSACAASWARDRVTLRGRARAGRRSRVTVAVAALTLGSAAVLGACGGQGPVTITPTPKPDGADRAACLALARALPDTVGTGLRRRDVTPATPFTAAWGSPPVAFSCGIGGVARTYRPDATLSDVNGVRWFTEDLGDTVRYSTPTRRPQVVLTLPASLQAFEVLASLSGPVLAATAARVG